MLTVTVEQTFSSESNILDEKEFTLVSDSLKAQPLLNDLTRVTKRI